MKFQLVQKQMSEGEQQRERHAPLIILIQLIFRDFFILSRSVRFAQEVE